MTLKAIVAALGGELYAGGRRANVPAPGHSARDRSVSLLLRDRRVVAHSFGAADWREVLDDLRARGLIDDQARLTGASAPRAAWPDPPPWLRIETARRLWAEAASVRAGTPAARYGARRGILRPLGAFAALRAHPATPVAVFAGAGAGPVAPALLAAITAPAGALLGVEITYLQPNGERARRLRLARKAVGRIPAGAAVRLEPQTGALLVAEGVFTALSAAEIFGLPGWALLSAGNLRRWRAPPGVREVLIAADRGAAGEAAAAALAAELAAEGVAACIRLPPPPHGDWNEAACAGREKEGRVAAPGPRGWAPPAGLETAR